MTKRSYRVADLLPHAPPMILLDELIAFDDEGCTAAITITPQCPFFVEGQGVPAYVGLEYMAQTCGMHAGRQARSQGQGVQIGYLLGSRDYHATQGWFTPGQRLIVRVREVFREAPMGVFDCEITCDRCTIASARLNVYQPSQGDGETTGAGAGT